MTEAKRTPAGRGGRGKGNNVRDIRQYKMKDGPIDRGDRGTTESGRQRRKGDGDRARRVEGGEGTVTEREETEAEVGTEMEGSELREAKDTEERDSVGMAANTGLEGTAIVPTVPEWE